MNHTSVTFLNELTGVAGKMELRNGMLSGLTIGNQRVSFPAVPALSLCRVTIHEKAMKHGMVQASNFVFDKKNATIAVGVYNFFKAKLMIPYILRNQATIL
jgi:hypothetical protein